MDEVFSLDMMSASFQNILFVTATDIHPHYIILKVVLSFFSLLFHLPINNMFSIIIGKLNSLIPLILLIDFALVKLRKDFGWLFSSIFIFLIVTMPKMMLYGFKNSNVFVGNIFHNFKFLFAYKNIVKSDNKNLALITLFSLMGVYTHYSME
ncbi:MAG: hypothetical protein LBV42_04780 [Methanobrevibacter sp.]|jgi:hypothetical protein|nr:hypothetical protein [Methanobrevibacter sp.]